MPHAFDPPDPPASPVEPPPEEPNPQMPDFEEPGGAGIPWEHRRRLGFWPALSQTIVQAFSETADFFRRVPPERPEPKPPFGPIGSPLVYALLVTLIPLWIAMVLQIPFTLSQLGGQGTLFVLFEAFLSPILIPLGLLLGAAIMHLILVILGAARHSMVATFRVVCYAQTPHILTAVPLCGAVIGGIWAIVHMIIGLSELHGASRAQAAVAVLLPILFSCGCFTVAGFLIAAAAQG